MSSPTFSQYSNTSLYWLDGSNSTVGFYAGSAEPQTLGSNPTLDTLWANALDGTFVLLPSAPSDPSGFCSALANYLPTQQQPLCKVLWITYPQAPPEHWQPIAITVGSPPDQSDPTYSINATAIALGHCELSIPSGYVLSLVPESSSLLMQSSDENSVAQFAMVAAAGSASQIQASSLALSFAQPTQGCLLFGLTLSPGVNNSQFSQLAVGIRYFFPLTAPQADGTSIGTGQSAVLLQNSQSFSMQATMDPINIVNPDRSNLSFFSPNLASGLPLTYDSTFGDTLGRPITLTPVAASGSTPDARLVFGIQPSGATVPVPGSTASHFYFTLQGCFTIGWSTSSTTPNYQLLCGTSPLEYIEFPAPDDTQTNQLSFVPGGPACTPGSVASSGAPPLTSPGTTAWILPKVSSDTIAPSYFAQPERSPLFQPNPTTPSTNQQSLPTTMDANSREFWSAAEASPTRVAGPSVATGIPMFGFFATDTTQTPLSALLALESSAIAPNRQQILAAAGAGTAKFARQNFDDDSTTEIAISPHGFSVGMTGDSWAWVGIANDQANARTPSVQFTQVSGEFRAALESNKLFMVAANPEVLMGQASVPFQATADILETMRDEGLLTVTQFTAVNAYFAGLAQPYPVYLSLSAFAAALTNAWSTLTPGLTPAQQATFAANCSKFTIQVGDWAFQLSPTNWSNPERPEHQNTIMVLKFTNDRSLEELTNDVDAWTWSAVAQLPNGGDVGATQRELQQLFAFAKAAEEQALEKHTPSLYGDFCKLLKDPHWTGVISFAVGVPLLNLGGPLQPLAAGLSARRLYAHHVGFSATPTSVKGGTATFQRTSVFAVIDYEDSADQYAKDPNSWPNFQFKVLDLEMRMNNSFVAYSACRAELMINRLFGANTLLYPTTHGNNVLLSGQYGFFESNDIQGYGYRFSMEGDNTVMLGGSALRKIDLLSVSLALSRWTAAKSNQGTFDCTFRITGNFHFFNNTDADIFSFGAEASAHATPSEVGTSSLRFGGLNIQMSSKAGGKNQSFVEDASHLTLDLQHSLARVNSLYSSFPVKLMGLISTPYPVATEPDSTTKPAPQLPENFGYTSITAPLQQSKLSDPWYGLVYKIELGSLGALGENAPLTLNLLTAWSAGDSQDIPPMYVGIQWPGVNGKLGVDLPFQGVIKLGFRAIEMLVNSRGTNPDGSVHRDYMLRFRNFALRFFGFAIPPGNNDVYVLGDRASGSDAIGWYAAYGAKSDPKPKQTPTARALAARKRITVTSKQRSNQK